MFLSVFEIVIETDVIISSLESANVKKLPNHYYYGLTFLSCNSFKRPTAFVCDGCGIAWTD
jgi:hypothetical protein